MIILFDDHQYRHYNRHARDPEEEEDLTPHVLRWNLELFKKKLSSWIILLTCAQQNLTWTRLLKVMTFMDEEP